MYLAEKTESQYFLGKFNSVKTTKKKFKTLDELAIHCLLNTQEIFLSEYKKAKLKPQNGRLDVADDHYRIAYEEFIDGERAIEMFFVDKDMKKLENFMNNRCEQYRLYSHYKFTKTK
ncbi:MAG: hypothetical protein K2W92_02855 [Alphaproteobacteria bacterium]|nr:hypothetical protein [Alphaproteobacteria bacterium]